MQVEYDPGQIEINPVPAWGYTTADNAFRLSETVK